MVSKTVKLKELISWSVAYEISRAGKELYVYFYPDEKTMLRIKLDKASIEALKQKRERVIAFLEKEITLSGDVMGRWEKRIVTKPVKEVEEWVKVE